MKHLKIFEDFEFREQKKYFFAIIDIFNIILKKYNVKLDVKPFYATFTKDNDSVIELSMLSTRDIKIYVFKNYEFREIDEIINIIKNILDKTGRLDDGAISKYIFEEKWQLDNLLHELSNNDVIEIEIDTDKYNL